MGSLKEELEKWKKSRYQKPMSVALAEVREGHDCDKEHPKRSHKDWMNTEPVKTVKEDMFDEGRMKDIYTMDQEGKSPEEIAKKLKINVKTVKGILGEETLHEFSDAQISQLKKEYEPLRGKTISGPNATKLMSIFDKFDKNKQLLIKILKANIPFVSMLAQARLISKHGANAAQLAQMRKEELEENAAVELQKKVAKGGMDKQMFQKSVDLLKSKKYDELKKHLKASDTAPREYVMDLIAKKEPATFKKMYGNQTGYYSLMNQNEAFSVQITKMDGGKFIHGTYKTKAEAVSAMKQALQDLIPVTLGGVQSANSISNRDVEFLITAFFGAGALDGGIFKLATEDTGIMVGRLQNAIKKMRSEQQRSLGVMRSIEGDLVNLYRPGTTESALGII